MTNTTNTNRCRTFNSGLLAGILATALLYSILLAVVIFKLTR